MSAFEMFHALWLQFRNAHLCSSLHPNHFLFILLLAPVVFLTHVSQSCFSCPVNAAPHRFFLIVVFPSCLPAIPAGPFASLSQTGQLRRSVFIAVAWPCTPLLTAVLIVSFETHRLDGFVAYTRGPVALPRLGTRLALLYFVAVSTLLRARRPGPIHVTITIHTDLHTYTLT